MRGRGIPLPPSAYAHGAPGAVVLLGVAMRAAKGGRMDMSRKRFVETLASGSALLLFSSCGGGGGYSSGAGGNPMPMSSCTPDIANNHGHALVVAVADLDSGTPK